MRWAKARRNGMPAYREGNIVSLGTPSLFQGLLEPQLPLSSADQRES